jgi:hypothetical protein
MKRVLFVLAGITCLASAPAFADDAAKPPDAVKAAAAAEASKPYTPRAGLWSLQLDGPAFPMWQTPFGYNTVRGIGATIPTGAGSTTGSGGVGGSVGYTLSDLVEVGAALGFVAAGGQGGNTSVGFNVEPFLKLNLGADMMSTDSRMNPFVLIGCGINILAPGGGVSNITFVTPELAAGMEFMLTHSFGVSVYVPITLGFNTSGGSAVLGLGLGYGLVGYF